jgi:O-antigen ligase
MSAAPKKTAMERLAPVSLALCLLYPVCLAIGNGPGNILLAILALSALPIVALRPELRSRPILIFSLLIILYLLAMAIRADLEGAPGRHFRAIDNYAFFAYAPFVGVHVAIALRYRITFKQLCLLTIAALVVGASARLFWNANWGAGSALFESYQWGGGGKNRNYLSIEAGLTLLASGSLLAVAISHKQWHWPLRLVGGLTLAGICVLAFLALLEMKSRTNWVAAAIAAIVWLVTLLVATLRRGNARRSLLAGTAIAFTILAIVGLAAFWSQIASRFSDDGGLAANIRIFAQIFMGTLDRASIDLQAYDPRLYIYVTARELISMKPWFGWGPDVAPLVNHYVPANVLGGRIHFHNASLEFLVGLGVVGTGLLALHLGAIAFASRRRSALPLEPDIGAILAALLASGLTYMGVVSLAESANRVELITQTLILIFALLLGRGSVGQALDGMDRPASEPQ